MTPTAISSFRDIYKTVVSLVDAHTGFNAFCREEADEDCTYKELRFISEVGRRFLAGVLIAIPDLMPLMCPNVS